MMVTIKPSQMTKNDGNQKTKNSSSEESQTASKPEFVNTTIHILGSTHPSKEAEKLPKRKSPVSKEDHTFDVETLATVIDKVEVQKDSDMQSSNNHRKPGEDHQSHDIFKKLIPRNITWKKNSTHFESGGRGAKSETKHHHHISRKPIPRIINVVKSTLLLKSVVYTNTQTVESVSDCSLRTFCSNDAINAFCINGGGSCSVQINKNTDGTLLCEVRIFNCLMLHGPDILESQTDALSELSSGNPVRVYVDSLTHCQHLCTEVDGSKYSCKKNEPRCVYNYERFNDSTRICNITIGCMDADHQVHELSKGIQRINVASGFFPLHSLTKDKK